MAKKKSTSKKRAKLPAGWATWIVGGGVVMPRLPWLARVPDSRLREIPFAFLPKLREGLVLLVAERQVVRGGDVDAKALKLFDAEAQKDIDAILTGTVRGAKALRRIEGLSLRLVRIRMEALDECPRCARPMPPSWLAACRAEDDAEDDRADVEPTKTTPLEEEVPLRGLDPCHESHPCAFLSARIAARLRGEGVEPIMVILAPSEGWWSAAIPSMSGRYSQGRTIPSALVHLADAMRGLEALEREGLAPAAKKKARTVIDARGGYIGSDGKLHKSGKVE
jgi:predicted RNase H-like HicB family nuclease